MKRPPHVPQVGGQSNHHQANSSTVVIVREPIFITADQYALNYSRQEVHSSNIPNQTVLPSISSNQSIISNYPITSPASFMMPALPLSFPPNLPLYDCPNITPTNPYHSVYQPQMHSALPQPYIFPRNLNQQPIDPFMVHNYPQQAYFGQPAFNPSGYNSFINGSTNETWTTHNFS